MNDKRGVLQKGNTEATRSVVIIKNIGQRNTDIGDRYVEMMVVVDKAVIGRHRNDEEVKRYVLTYLKLASAILQHSDITKYGLKIHLVLAKLVLLRRDLSDVRLDPDERENNLRKVCNYMNKIGNGGSRKYDHKLFLTRNDFGMGGYANTRGMCSHYTSCSMVYDHGFTASFLVAHELAHS
ncbi:A disintegrin and metallo ase with thrombospondin motifs 2-like isoform X2, partial [Paramuricea clavata]